MKRAKNANTNAHNEFIFKNNERKKWKLTSDDGHEREAMRAGGSMPTTHFTSLVLL